MTYEELKKNIGHGGLKQAEIAGLLPGDGNNKKVIVSALKGYNFILELLNNKTMQPIKLKIVFDPMEALMVELKNRGGWVTASTGGNQIIYNDVFYDVVFGKDDFDKDEATLTENTSETAKAEFLKRNF